MMAVMVLGMPQVHSCHANASPEMLWSGEMSEAGVCPPAMFRDEAGVSVMGEQLDPSHWRKLPAIHCQATQSVLTGKRAGRAADMDSAAKSCGSEPS
jgi:hypothetical protein